jgi:hypothetical protein
MVNRKTVFRPKRNLISGIVAITLTSLYATQSVLYPTGALEIDLAVSTITTILSWRIWISPKVILDVEQITVVNPFKNVRIVPTNITKIETKWALKIHHDQMSTVVWVGQATGKRTWIGRQVDLWNRPHPAHPKETLEPISATYLSHSGTLAALIKDKYDLRID